MEQDNGDTGLNEVFIDGECYETYEVVACAYRELKERANKLGVLNKQLENEIKILVSGLENIKRHLEVIGGALGPRSTAYAIAKKALEDCAVNGWMRLCADKTAAK